MNKKKVTKDFIMLHGLKHPCICYAIVANPIESIKNIDNEQITTFVYFSEFFDSNLKVAVLKKLLDNTAKTRFVVEMAHAFSYIHKNGLIYRNLNIDCICLIVLQDNVKIQMLMMTKMNFQDQCLMMMIPQNSCHQN